MEEKGDLVGENSLEWLGKTSFFQIEKRYEFIVFLN